MVLCKGRRGSLLTAVFVVIIALGLALPAAAAPEAGVSGSNGTLPGNDKVEKILSPAALNIMEIPDTVRLEVPAGVLAGNAACSVSVLGDAEAKSSRMLLVSRVVDITMKSGSITGNVYVTLYYGKQTLGRYQDPAVFRYDTGQNRWVLLEGTIDYGKGTITAEAERLGVFAVFAVAGLPEVDKTAPKVKATNPVIDAVDVPVDEAITIVFSEDVQIGETLSGIVLRNVACEDVQADVAISEGDRRLVYIRPVKSLEYDADYYVYIPAEAIKDTAGNSLQEMYTFNFKTRPDPETDYYQVVKSTYLKAYPSPTDAGIAVLKPGNRVRRIRTLDDYHEVSVNLWTGKQYKSTTGFVLRNTVKRLKPESTAPQNPEAMVYLVAQPAQLRMSASSDGRVLIPLLAGYKVRYLAASGDYCKVSITIRTREGYKNYVGYAPKSCLKDVTVMVSGVPDWITGEKPHWELQTGTAAYVLMPNPVDSATKAMLQSCKGRKVSITGYFYEGPSNYGGGPILGVLRLDLIE
ncbi:MAG: Ig-like domain-containing protein [Bacillota bacterium]